MMKVIVKFVGLCTAVKASKQVSVMLANPQRMALDPHYALIWFPDSSNVPKKPYPIENSLITFKVTGNTASGDPVTSDPNSPNPWGDDMRWLPDLGALAQDRTLRSLDGAEGYHYARVNIGPGTLLPSAPSQAAGAALYAFTPGGVADPTIKDGRAFTDSFEYSFECDSCTIEFQKFGSGTGTPPASQTLSPDPDSGTATVRIQHSILSYQPMSRMAATTNPHFYGHYAIFEDPPKATEALLPVLVGDYGLEAFGLRRPFVIGASGIQVMGLPERIGKQRISRQDIFRETCAQDPYCIAGRFGL